MLRFQVIKLIYHLRSIAWKKDQIQRRKYVLVPKGEHNWILGAIAKGLNKGSSMEIISPLDLNLIDKNASILILHYKLLRSVFLQGIDLNNCSVLITHFSRDIFHNREEFRYYFKKLSKVFTMNSQNSRVILSEFGKNINVEVVVMGVEKDMFHVTNRESREKIGICAAFYERKNPELIHRLIKKLPEFQFQLIGKRWDEYLLFEELQKSKNFEYLEEIPYSQYPIKYNNFKIFLSVSKLEGGPIPLVESMACGCYPIVSDTGAARDIIKSESEGIVIQLSGNLELDFENFANAIRFRMNSNNSTSFLENKVDNFTWKKVYSKLSDF